MRNTLEVLHCLVVDICRGRERLARMYYSVTYSRDFLRRRYAAVLFVRKALHNEVESVGMICEGLFNDVLFAVDFVRDFRAFDAYALYTAFANYFFVVHLDKLVFKRGTACVYDQNFHKNSPLFSNCFICISFD